jgi:hypothetical protein
MNTTYGTPYVSTNTSTTSIGPTKPWTKQRRCVPYLTRSWVPGVSPT